MLSIHRFTLNVVCNFSYACPKLKWFKCFVFQIQCKIVTWGMFYENWITQNKQKLNKSKLDVLCF